MSGLRPSDVMLRIMMLLPLVAMMRCLPQNFSEATSSASASSLVKRHHLPQANIIEKSLTHLR